MADVHDIANAVLTPTPQPAPTPVPTSSSAPLPSDLLRIHNASQLSPDWNVALAPHLSMLGATGGPSPNESVERLHGAYSMWERMNAMHTQRAQESANYYTQLFTEAGLPSEQVAQKVARLTAMHAETAPSVLSYVVPEVGRLVRDSALGGTGLAGLGHMLYSVVGDPFHHNIRELGPPPGVSPLDTNRLFWRERAL